MLLMVIKAVITYNYACYIIIIIIMIYNDYGMEGVTSPQCRFVMSQR